MIASKAELAIWNELGRWPMWNLNTTLLVPQFKIGRYYVDFALPDLKLAVEIDGRKYHSERDVFVRDRQRQRVIEKAGWRVVRFAALETLNDPAACLMELHEIVSTMRMKP